MLACSYWKRQNETASRHKWLKTAYTGLKHWVAQGNPEITKLKRYILRHLRIPSTDDGLTLPRFVSRACSLARPQPPRHLLPHSHNIREQAHELLMEFANEYVNALLNYCDDEQRKGTH